MSDDLREKLWSIAAERPNSQYEADKCADHLFEIVDIERRRYAIEQLDKLKEKTTNPKGEWKYGIVAIQYIEAAINRLKGEQ